MTILRNNGSDGLCRLRWSWLGLGLLGMSLLAVVGCGQRVEHDAATDLARLAEALGPSRLIEARLSAFDRHVPCDANGPRDARCAEPPPYGTPAFERLAAITPWLREATLRSGDASGRHALGLWSLVWAAEPKDLSEAIRILEQASRGEAQQPELWNDLAAVYLVRAQAADDPLDLLNALEWVERSLALQPDGLAARFNRALVLEKLSLSQLARTAWSEYLQLDVETGWAREAEAYLAQPHPNASVDAWADAQPALQQALKNQDGAAIRQLVDRHRKPVRQWAENEWLTGWALGGDEAADALDSARLVGEALVSVDGDDLLHDSVAAIDAAIDAGDPGTLQRLAAGHRAYAQAYELLMARNCEQAFEPIADAIEHLTPLTPFAYRARFVEVRCAYRANQRQRAVTLGQELARDLETLGKYPVLLGRSLWLVGTSSRALGRLGPAEQAYRQAVEPFLRVGEVASAAAVKDYAAGVYDDMGDARQGWRQRLEALRLLADAPNARRLRLILQSAAISAAGLGKRHSALRFADAGLHLARLQEREDPQVAADAVVTHLWQRAVFLRQLGRSAQALDDLAEALAVIERVDSDEDLKSLVPEVWLEQGKSLAAAGQPDAALERFDAAEEQFRRAESLYFLPALEGHRAQGWSELGDLEAASASLDRAVAMLEGQRQDLQRPWHRMAWLDRAGDVYDQRLALYDQHSSSPRRLLELAEQARSRVLLDWLLDLGTAPPHVLKNAAQPASQALPEIIERLPSTSAFWQFEVLADRLLIWTIHNGAVESHSSVIDRAAFEQQLAAWRQALTSSDRRIRETEPALAAALWRQLILPMQSGVSSATTWIISADGALHGLPFAALLDEDQRLIETRRLAFIPSLGAYGELLARPPNPGVADSSVLVVADPAFDPQRFDVRQLESALRESAAVANRFSAEVLQGVAATPEAVLASLAEASAFHYSGHALANARLPLQSSLLLAPGQQGDGRLFVSTLLEQPLGHLDWVVLSACETAYGGYVSREGVIGLVWPFLAQGVDSVVASLWQVGDRPTAALFETFYESLSNGETMVDALRIAQLERLAAGDSHDWAAFQFYGVVPP